MKSQNKAKGIRPGFPILAACVVAAVALPLWLLLRKPASIPADPELAQAAESAVNPEPAATPPPETVAAQPTRTEPPSALEEKGGIQVSRVALAMSGAAVDVRYTIVNPEKLAAIPDAKDAAYLVDEATGTKVTIGPPAKERAVPAHSRARSAAMMMRDAGTFPPTPSRVVVGKTYSILLPNPSGAVRSGSKVGLVVGDLRADGLTVE
jgi:hypothetical protein